MLSFMKDEEGQDKGLQANTSSDGLSSNKESGQVSQNVDQKSQVSSLSETLSDSGGLEKAPTQDYLVPSASGKKVKYSTMILGLVFLIGAGSLFFVIKKYGPDEAKAGPTQEELKLAEDIAKMDRAKKEINKKMNDIVDRISSVSKVQQVPVHELKKNPFVQNTSFLGVDVSQYLENEKKGQLKLWSVMQSGGQKTCMINDRVYKVGDRVGIYTVKSIGQELVELTAGEKKLVLRISK